MLGAAALDICDLKQPQKKRSCVQFTGDLKFTLKKYKNSFK